MTELELIDNQNEIINIQQKIIHEQAVYIKEMKTLNKAFEDKWEDRRTDAENSVDFLEIEMRHINSTPVR